MGGEESSSIENRPISWRQPETLRKKEQTRNKNTCLHIRCSTPFICSLEESLHILHKFARKFGHGLSPINNLQQFGKSKSEILKAKHLRNISNYKLQKGEIIFQRREVNISLGEIWTCLSFKEINSQ